MYKNYFSKLRYMYNFKIKNDGCDQNLYDVHIKEIIANYFRQCEF